MTAISTTGLNLDKLANIVVSDAEAAKRHEQRREREELVLHGDGFLTAPKRHREAVGLQVDGPWGQKLSWLKGEAGKGILVALIGKGGPGKTQMGVEVMRHMDAKNFKVQFITCMRIFMHFKAAYRQGSDKSELVVLEEFCKPKLLVIDEVDKRGETEWENNLLFELINQRYGDMRDTILTCNMTKAELATSMGPSIVSRMLETGGVIECNWESYRGKK